MKEIILKAQDNLIFDDATLYKALHESIVNMKNKLKKVLLIPPDITRIHSEAGKITTMYYEILKDTCNIDIMPALGTHEPMSGSEIIKMFGSSIPIENFIKHDWRNDVVKIGEIPGDYISSISDGLIGNPIDVEVNKRLLDKSYDLIISIGQVVPHEVIGMANYSKNIFVGCGGSSMINQTHMLGAFYGMERIMGRDNSPVRKALDYAEKAFIKDLPLMYVLTVTTQIKGKTNIDGLFIGRRREIFEEAVKLSQEKNITFLDIPLKKVVVYLNENEYKSTWLGNKAIYRTRMVIDDGGELIILAPGVRKFGEDKANDALIRKYGYAGRRRILELSRFNVDLKQNLSAAAHLIHGSSDSRFSITYAVDKLSKNEIEGVGYKYMALEDAYKKYDPEKLKDGINTMGDSEEIFYISNPAIGLWADKSKF